MKRFFLLPAVPGLSFSAASAREYNREQFPGFLHENVYRNKAGEVLVKCYMNEREARLLTLPGGPYYRREEVNKAFRHVQ